MRLRGGSTCSPCFHLPRSVEQAPNSNNVRQHQPSRSSARGYSVGSETAWERKGGKAHRAPILFRILFRTATGSPHCPAHPVTRPDPESSIRREMRLLGKAGADLDLSLMTRQPCCGFGASRRGTPCPTQRLGMNRIPSQGRRGREATTRTSAADYRDQTSTGEAHMPRLGQQLRGAGQRKP